MTATQPPAWAGAYVGIPYVDHGRDRAGCDCWGLVRLIIAERTRFVLPSFATDYDGEADSVGVGRCVEAAHASGAWTPVDGRRAPSTWSRCCRFCAAETGSTAGRCTSACSSTPTG